MIRAVILIGLAFCLPFTASATSYTLEHIEGRWDCGASKSEGNMWTRAYYTINSDGTGNYNATVSIKGEEGEMIIQFTSDVEVSVFEDRLHAEILEIRMRKVSLGNVVFDELQMEPIKSQIMSEPKSVSKMAVLSKSVLEYETDGLWYYCTPREQ